MSETWDLIICGGGLAGLCLALQVLQKRPLCRCLVLDRATEPSPEAAFKVGESTVEIGAHYFAEVLGLGEHLRQAQLPKLGLRYFFPAGENRDLRQRFEVGGRHFYQTGSFQIDRGRFENHLRQSVRAAGGEVRSACRVRRLQLQAQAPHSVELADGEHLCARFVADASGRRALIKNERGSHQPLTDAHPCSAVWLRLPQRIEVDAWLRDDPLVNDPGHPRWLSTNHLVGAGYWLWLIPLASGGISVGLVIDERLHPFTAISSLPALHTWLQEHEPLVATAVAAQAAAIQDFRRLRHYAHRTDTVFDPAGWCLLGEAGVFLDPFYSPGSDFIALGNTYACDLISRHLDGEAIGVCCHVYNSTLLQLFDNWLSIYRDAYAGFGHGPLMACKIIWDFAYYWAIPANIFFTGSLTRPMLLARLQNEISEANQLNAGCQATFRRWQSRPQPCGRAYVDLCAIAPLQALNAALKDPTQDLASRLAWQLPLLRQLAAEVDLLSQHDFASPAELPELRILTEVARATVVAGPAACA